MSRPEQETNSETMTTYIVHLNYVDDKPIEIQADNMGVMENGTLFFEKDGKRVAAFAASTWSRVTPKP